MTSNKGTNYDAEIKSIIRHVHVWNHRQCIICN